MDYERAISESRARLVNQLSGGGREVYVNHDVEGVTGRRVVRLSVVVVKANGRSEGSEGFTDPADDADVPRLTAELYARTVEEWERFAFTLLD
jgi:hypothetical protein